MTLQNYYLGCPIWSNKAWVGELFSADARAADFLRQYASVFNTVEGNTTFYGMPTEATVARWGDETPPSFRFCFKFPRAISHDLRLAGAERETDLFLERLAPLGARLGPFFLQLPPSFGAGELPTLERYLAALPADFAYAVEVRHRDFWDEGAREAELDTMLRTRGVDRVLFDTRALRAADASDRDVREAQRRKPNVPLRRTVTGPHPFLRFIADPNVAANEALLAEWAEWVGGWIEDGRTPFVFFHAPDDFYAPRLARLFHGLLAARVAVGTLPRWPAEGEEPPAEQLSLF